MKTIRAAAVAVSIIGGIAAAWQSPGIAQSASGSIAAPYSREEASLDPGAYSRAIEERMAIVEATGNDPAALAGLPGSTQARRRAPGFKTAGLPATPAGWTNLTGQEHPVGRINDLLIDPAGTPSTRTMWAATDGGGIWKSTNSGTTWTPISDALPSLSIGKIVRSPVNPLVMYASTNPFDGYSYGPAGVMKSSDGGNTWTVLPATRPGINGDFVFVSHLAIGPTQIGGQDVLLAATNSGVFNAQYKGGIYLSADSGASWNKISDNVAGTFVAFHPTDSNRRAYALMNGQFFVTETGNFPTNATSTLVSGTATAFTKFAWAPGDITNFIALAQDAVGATKLWRSKTGGTSWEPIALPTTPSPIAVGVLAISGALWIDPTNINRIAVGEAFPAGTVDVTTSTATTGWTFPSLYWKDVHGIFNDPGYDGNTNKMLYMVDDGGLYRYDNIDNLAVAAGGTQLATGMTITEAFSAAGRGGNVLLGAQAVSTQAYRTDPPFDPASKWRLVGVAGTNGFWIGDGMAAAASRTNPNVLYGALQLLDPFRSDDGGKTAVSICGVAPNNITEGACGANANAPLKAALVLDPSNSSNLYAGGNSLWRTLNATARPPGR